mmetsp:Transcript_11307/g.34788  ORF Transcript_11307/g.34788 Transcript_11307/m.34788 type:complete len:225 (+) Transcript_11307:90-764(+)
MPPDIKSARQLLSTRDDPEMSGWPGWMQVASSLSVQTAFIFCTCGGGRARERLVPRPRRRRVSRGPSVPRRRRVSRFRSFSRRRRVPNSSERRRPFPILFAASARPRCPRDCPSQSRDRPARFTLDVSRRTFETRRRTPRWPTVPTSPPTASGRRAGPTARSAACRRSPRPARAEATRSSRRGRRRAERCSGPRRGVAWRVPLIQRPSSASALAGSRGGGRATS